MVFLPFEFKVRSFDGGCCSDYMVIRFWIMFWDWSKLYLDEDF